MHKNMIHNQNQADPQLYNSIAEFWPHYPNNEIYLRDHPDIIPGSKEYFEIILAARRKYIYYFPSMTEWLNGSPSKKLLEIGCGMGTDALVFAQQGFSITGIDLSPVHIDLADKLFTLYSLPGNFLKGNAENTPIPDNSFGCVYSFGVLHHTPDTACAINEVYRVLVPSGRAVIMLYHKKSLNNFVHWVTRKGFENVNSENDAPITQRFTKKDVRSMCSHFRICNIRTEYLYGVGYKFVYDYTPRVLFNILSKIVGWHLVIYLEK
jgi:ubiquinone/menaquinone biosynthesis C-methylase UbiE